MITTPVFIITIAIVVLLAAIATWLVRKSATAMQRQLQANNQDLRQQLQSATGKAEMLMAENTNIKAQHAAASESARMMRLRVDELNASVEALNGEIKALDDVKDALDRDKASLL